MDHFTSALNKQLKNIKSNLTIESNDKKYIKSNSTTESNDHKKSKEDIKAFLNAFQRKRVKHETDNDKTKTSSTLSTHRELPPDERLQEMDIIIDVTLPNVSLDDWYENCWSENNNEKTQPFYGPWLESKGNEDVVVESWKFADSHSEKTDPSEKSDSSIKADPSEENNDNSISDESFVGPWDGEVYGQKREVTFRFMKSGGFSSGYTDVKQTHFCRKKEGQYIVALNVETKNIPFADCFTVQIRWVATQLASNDLSLQVGLYVNFLKSVMVASQIRAGAKEKTAIKQKELLQAMKDLCCDGAELENANSSVKSNQLEPSTQSAWYLRPFTGLLDLTASLALFFFHSAVNLVASFGAAVLVHPAIKDSIVEVLAASLERVAHDPRFDESLVTMSAALANHANTPEKDSGFNNPFGQLFAPRPTRNVPVRSRSRDCDSSSQLDNETSDMTGASTRTASGSQLPAASN